MRGIAIPLAKILVSAALIVLLLNRIGTAGLVNTVKSANPLWIIIGLAVFTMSNIIGSIQWRLLLKARGIDLPLTKVISFYFVGLFFNNFLIGYIGGDAFRIYDTSKISGDTSGAVSAVSFDRFVGFFILITMGLVASIIGLDIIKSESIIYAVIIIFLCWILALIFLFREDFAKKFSWFFNLILPKSIRHRLKDIYLGLNSYKHEKAVLAKVVGLSLITQSLRIVTHYFAALSVGVHASLVYFWVFIPVIALAASLPISLGGIGVREQSGVVLFSQIGLPTAEIAAFEFLAYIIGIIASIPGGIIFAFRKRTERAAEIKFSKGR